MDAIVANIKNNLRLVEQNIERATLSVGRRPEDIRLVVVSKAQPAEIIQAAYTAGVRCFGENYPQEAETKIKQLAHLERMEWHMIGHLQSRKAPIIAKSFHMIHSIDSLSLAEKLNRILGENGKVLPALLEVNVSGEESKFGWPAGSHSDWMGLLDEFGKILELPNLKIQGLMTMPPFFENPELARPFFKTLGRLRDFLRTQFPFERWAELSMGTSMDYPVAIQEGATIIRVGQAILGPRPAHIDGNPGDIR